MSALIESLGIKLEIAAWRNIVPHVWSVHVRDADSPMLLHERKGRHARRRALLGLG